ncbi:MAG: PAS domain S-box protein, partial [Alphaproteobacteria bacterium]
MMHRALSSRRFLSALLPAATAALAAAIFVAELMTSEKLTAALFYALVVLLAARFCNARTVLSVGVGCVGLTVLANVLPTFGGAEISGLKTTIGATVIGLTTFLAFDRKRAEHALRESEEQWREVFEHNPVMYFMVSPIGTVLSVNGFGAAQLGFAAAELVGQSVLNVFFEEDRELVKAQLAICVEELGRSHNWEIRKIRKDGRVIWVSENAKAVRRAGNDAIVLIACEDITERRRDEQRRAAQHAATRTGASLQCDCLWHAPGIEIAEFDAASQERSFTAGEGRVGQVWRSAKPIWMVDATTEPQFLRASAAAKAGLHGAVIFPILLDTEALGVIELFSRAPREPDPKQLATLSAIGSQIGQYIKRQRAEVAVRASEERWRRLFETSAAGMALTRLDGVFTAANPALQRMFGRTEEEIVGRSALELNLEDERAGTAEALAKFRSGLLTERQTEKKYLRKDGTPVWLNITTTLVPATETAACFLQAIYMDVTERVQFEAALRASEERWRCMFEIAPVGIVTFDFERRKYLTANESFQRMTGYTEAELRNLTPLELTHEDDRAAMQERIDGGTVGVLQRKRYRRKDGEVVWADVTSFVIPATDSTPAFRGAVIVDITDRKRAEEALQQAQADLARLNRVMLLGEMTASIAHEVNQPIAATVTNAHAGLRWLGARSPDLEEVRQALGRIVRDGSRAGEVIGRIRAHVKRMPPRRELLDINEAIREVIALTQTEVQRNGVRLQTPLGDDLPFVPADRVQLQQVIMNLVVNAVEAMSAIGDRSR